MAEPPVITLRAGVAGVLAVAAVALSLLLPATAAAGVPGPGWTTWGNSAVRQSRASTSLLTAKNARRLEFAWSRPIGGAGAAQPLYLTRIAIGGQRRDIYVTASESGRVSAFDATTGRVLWTRELGALNTGCAQMPRGVFGVTGTPVYDPSSGYVYVAATNMLWALDVRTGAPRTGWPVALPIDDTHETVWGALALGNGQVYMGLASYCDRRPYTGRVLAVSTSTGAVDHSFSTVTTASGEPGGGGIWGWGGIALAKDGHVWAASANANAKDLPDEASSHAESVLELTSSLSLIDSNHAPDMPHRGDFGFGSTPVVFNPVVCGKQLVAAEGKDGALYVYQADKLSTAPVQRLVLAFPATLYGSPAWDPLTQQLFVTTTQGYAGQPAGLDALTVTKACKVKRLWTHSQGGQLSAVPTVANDTVIVATGTGHLRVYATATGKLIAQRSIHGAAFEAPIAVGGDVAVVTWSQRLLVYRLAKAKKPAKH